MLQKTYPTPPNLAQEYKARRACRNTWKTLASGKSKGAAPQKIAPTKPIAPSQNNSYPPMPEYKKLKMKNEKGFEA